LQYYLIDCFAKGYAARKIASYSHMLRQITSATGRTIDLAVSWLGSLRGAWGHSLRFRLLTLGLMPLLIVFPVVIAVLVIVGGERSNSLMLTNLRSNLAGSRNYLDQLRTETGTRVGQLVESDRLVDLVAKNGKTEELNQVLATSARASGLDYLVVAFPDGTVVGSSGTMGPTQRLPDSYVIRQARIGVTNAAYERFDAEHLAALSMDIPEKAKLVQTSADGSPVTVETRGLVINAAAHFPLSVNAPDAILVGGIMLNRNFTLIEHMREIIFPIGALPGEGEGLTSLYLDDTRISISRQRKEGLRPVGDKLNSLIGDTVLVQGQVWTGTYEQGAQSYTMGFEPLTDGDGVRIGMLGAGFPIAPYQRTARLMLGMIAGLLALTMLGLSLVFLGAGRELTQRLARISETMTVVRQGDRLVRVGNPLRNDELGQLTRHFDSLLDTISAQDEMRRAALQVVADEASRRRALFEHERDGVAILNPDGSVFEANPKCAEMLGYTAEEFTHLHIHDWDARFESGQLNQIISEVGTEGALFETLHRRKDGSSYSAEVSISLAQWADRTFALILQRDISERKAAEAELENYRRLLEDLVNQRTKELQDRSEQLNAIFTLSPDGFVSFNSELRLSFANPAFLRLTGMDAEEILGLDENSFSSLLVQKSLANAQFPGVAMLRAARRKVGAGGTATDDVHGRRQLFELVEPESRVIEVDVRLSEAENVSQILYFRDVTHETVVDRMKSEFLSAAAHELRTPMASIYGYAELLLAQEFEPEMRKELVGTIFHQSELMASIINELLDLARIEARRGKDFLLEKISLQDVVDEVVAGYKPPNERPEPEIAMMTGLYPVEADRKKIHQALLNVLSNAYKYSPAGGVVSLSLTRDTENECPRVGITVTDHGIGMTGEQVARVFERFYRADASGKISGTGLGMSIVKEIVELHGGEVSVESRFGKGTSVTLWFPESAAQHAIPAVDTA
jgi:PAS domain S-box-containing protein